MDTSGVHLWLVLMKAHRALEKHALSSISATGLCFSDFQILELLLHKGATPVNTLATRIGLTSGSGTSAVDRLAARGLVERQSGFTDRRVRVVHLTSAGRKLIEKAFKKHAADMEAVATVLTPTERTEALALLRRLGKGTDR